jgi:hypothetical protein
MITIINRELYYENNSYLKLKIKFQFKTKNMNDRILKDISNNKNKMIKKIFKFMVLLFVIIIIKKFKTELKQNIYWINEDYLIIQKNLNLSFPNNIKHKIRIGIFCKSLKNGGIERLVTILNVLFLWI